MKALFNNRIVDNEIAVSINDRALQFGDGLFETIGVKARQIQYLAYHMERLLKGAKVLNLNLPEPITGHCEENILRTLAENGLREASVKLMVWRGATASKGYGFDAGPSHCMIIPRSVKPLSPIIEKADFAKTIYFQYSALSGIKTLNSLPYIIASNEKQQRNLDELIVLNEKGFICECPAANVFWQQQDKFFTPPLTSGCLEGVTRKVLIEKFRNTGITIEEQEVTPKELMEAKAIFTTNSSGVRFIQQLRNKQLDTSLANDSLFHI